MTAVEETAQPQTLEERYPIPEGKTGIGHLLNRHGDTPFMWNAEDEDDVRLARETFARYKKEGYIAYRVTGKNGERGEVIKAFDPAAERIIFVKQHQGG